MEDAKVNWESFCRHIGKLVQASARPLETLSNLIYLAKVDPENASAIVEYMKNAESELTQITGILYVMRAQVDWSKMFEADRPEREIDVYDRPLRTGS